jgi:hypothetical protein
MRAASGAPPSTTTVTGESRYGGNSDRSASSSRCALADFGRTRASTDVSFTPRNGSPIATSKVATAIAIRPGKRVTKRASRYQNPRSTGLASRSARRARNRGARALTRAPSSARIAGRTVSAMVAAISATKKPAIPIE